MEWSQAGDCRNNAGMGKKHDLERATASGQLQQHGIPERDLLAKVAMQAIKASLERNPILSKWDILIRPC